MCANVVSPFLLDRSESLVSPLCITSGSSKLIPLASSHLPPFHGVWARIRGNSHTPPTSPPQSLDGVVPPVPVPKGALLRMGAGQDFHPIQLQDFTSSISSSSFSLHISISGSAFSTIMSSPSRTWGNSFSSGGDCSKSESNRISSYGCTGGSEGMGLNPMVIGSVSSFSSKMGCHAWLKEEASSGIRWW